MASHILLIFDSVLWACDSDVTSDLVKSGLTESVIKVCLYIVCETSSSLTLVSQ